jgi:hypothetical protein
MPNGQQLVSVAGANIKILKRSNNGRTFAND